MKVLSFIVPSFNSEKTIKKCIDSILRIATIETEIIIVDNNSVDHTYQIEKKICETSDLIKIFKESKKGVSNARNRGIEEANGKYYWFVDSDDEIILSKKNFEKLIQLLTLNDGITILMNYKKSNNREKTIENKKKKYSKKEFYENFEDIFWKNEFNVIWNKIYSKKIIDNFNLSFDNNYISGEDAIFNYDYFNNVQDVYLKCYKSYKYYINSNQSKDFTFYRMEKIYQNDVNRIDVNEKFYKKNDIKQTHNLLYCEKINCCFGEYENVFNYSSNYFEYIKNISNYSIKKSINLNNIKNKLSLSFILKLLFIKIPFLSYIFFYFKKEK